jgi:hypothetical protein
MTAQPYPAPVPIQDRQSSRDVLAALGKPITLADGSTVHVRYSMASLRVLEQRFGSLKGISAELNEAQRVLQSDSGVGSGPIFSILSDALCAGLIHETRTDVDDDGRPVRYKLGKDRDRAEELLDPARLQEYLDAFASALQEAFGDLGGEAGRAALEAAQLSYPGASGSTSPPSSAAAPIDSSGG